MKAIDPELLRERTRVLETHLARLRDALPDEVGQFSRGTDAADAVALRLLMSIQVVLDLSVFACIHFGLQAPSSYDDSVARLAHAGRIDGALASRLENAASFRDAFVHAYNDLDPASIHRAARTLPDDLRMFMADLAGHLGE